MGCAVRKATSTNSREDPATASQPTEKETNNMASSFPTQNSPQRAGSKVSLKQGRSLMDWIRLTNSGKDIQGFGGKLQKVSVEELSKHNNENDVWLSIRGHVYNITEYLEYHPGGIPEIMKGAGVDATQIFNEVHQWVNAESMLQKCLIGTLVHNPRERKRNSSSKTPPSLSLLPPPTGLSIRPKEEPEFWKCSVASVTDITHNVKLICFRLPDGVTASAPVGHHVHMKRTISGMEITRPYTVVEPLLSRRDSRQEHNNKTLYLMIKVYPTGTLTPSLQNINIGDQCLLNGYSGNFQISRLKDAKYVCMLAGGTGFTPMIRIIHLFTQGELPSLRMLKLLFANREEKDIIWKNELDELVKYSDERFQVFYFLSNPPQSWPGNTGRITESVLGELLPRCPDAEKEKEQLICVCGPDPFTTEQIKNLKNLGHQDASIHAFLG